MAGLSISATTVLLVKFAGASKSIPDQETLDPDDRRSHNITAPWPWSHPSRPRDCRSAEARTSDRSPVEPSDYKSQIGRKWTLLSRLLRGRTPGVVKNRWKRLYSAHLDALNDDDTLKSDVEGMIERGSAVRILKNL
jgi:hypothetical protein